MSIAAAIEQRTASKKADALRVYNAAIERSIAGESIPLDELADIISSAERTPQEFDADVERITNQRTWSALAKAIPEVSAALEAVGKHNAQELSAAQAEVETAKAALAQAEEKLRAKQEECTNRAAPLQKQLHECNQARIKLINSSDVADEWHRADSTILVAPAERAKRTKKIGEAEFEIEGKKLERDQQQQRLNESRRLPQTQSVISQIAWFSSEVDRLSAEIADKQSTIEQWRREIVEIAASLPRLEEARAKAESAALS
jgi:chromosome segregation ATPase